MEAAGVAVGIIALIGTFKECIDLFSYFTVARSLGRDYELLSTKLDVEKTLLLQWVQWTNLLQPNYDRRLDDPGVRATVAQVLSGVRLLLSDTKTLQQRYGVRESQVGDEVNCSLSDIGANRMSTFTQDFGKLNLRIQSHQAVSYTKKARWAVRDKDKFDDLLQELSYFVSRLHTLVPHTAKNTQRNMIEEDVSSLDGSRAVRLLSEATTGRDDVLEAVAEAHHIQTCESRILRSIWYRLMDERRDALSPPNPQTFKWALNPTATELKWDNIASWLSREAGIYWVCGKAGSGKSTLMRYIDAHPKTKKLLNDWAGRTPLTIASFFFWYLGTELQKSQEGLSRALLFKILDSDRSLIPRLLPTMWTDAFGSDNIIMTPSSTELHLAFEKMGQIHSPNRKFCIFVDGLDEYCGNPRDGAVFLQNLAKNQNIKIVVSSRPIQPCVQAFSQMPKLYLQNLTVGDIKSYINQSVFSHPHIHALYRGKGSQVDSLRHNLIEKASGVFLWVVLACRSVQEGLDNFDHLSDLQHRVEELPPELEKLFQHMLNKISHRYRDYAAKILRTCHQNQLELNTQRLSTLGLALADDHDLDLRKLPSAESLKAAAMLPSSPSHRKNCKEKYAKCMILEGRLRSRCLGLVEIKGFNPSHNGNCFCGHWLINSTVEFMHRTVFDFLCAGGLAVIEGSMKDRDKFHPAAVLSCVSLHLLGLTLYDPKRGACHVDDVLTHAANVGAGRYAAAESLFIMLHEVLEGRSFDSIDSSRLAYIYGSVDKQSRADIKASKLHLAMLLAVELGLDQVVQLYNCMGRGKLSELSLHIPFLWRALVRFIKEESETRTVNGRSGTRNWTSRTVAMTRSLIEYGCDPNEQFLDLEGMETTPWKSLLDEIVSLSPDHSYGVRDICAQILHLYVEGGADLDFAAIYCAQKVETSAQEESNRDLLGMSELHERPPKGGANWVLSDLLCKIDDYRAKSSLETFPGSSQVKTILEPYSTERIGAKPPPEMLKSSKRARSLNPLGFERRKLLKLDADE